MAMRHPITRWYNLWNGTHAMIPTYEEYRVAQDEMNSREFRAGRMDTLGGRRRERRHRVDGARVGEAPNDAQVDRRSAENNQTGNGAGRRFGQPSDHVRAGEQARDDARQARNDAEAGMADDAFRWMEE